MSGIKIRTRLRVAVAMLASVAMFGGAVDYAVSAAPQRATVITPGSPRPAGSSVVRPGASIENAMSARLTGMFTVANATLASDGTVQTIALLDNGRIVDMMSRRNGVILPRIGGTLTRTYSAQQYQQLLAYGLDRGLTGAQKTQFLALAAPAASAPARPATPPCPADYAAMKPAQKFAVVRDNPAYAGCSGQPVSLRAPAQLQIGFVPEARAADISLLFFEVSPSAFFSAWGIEYEADNYFAFNIGGVRAIFGLGG